MCPRGQEINAPYPPRAPVVKLCPVERFQLLCIHFHDPISFAFPRSVSDFPFRAVLSANIQSVRCGLSVAEDYWDC